MPRREVRGRIIDEAQPLLGQRRLSRAFSTQDPAKLADELGRLVDAVEAMQTEYAAPRLTMLPVVYGETELALGFLAPVEPGNATVTATLPFTAPAFAGCSLVVAKRGSQGTVRVMRRRTDQLFHDDRFFFDCSEPGLYTFFTDGERWYYEPDWNLRIAGIESAVETALTIGSPRLLGRYSMGIGLAQEVTLDASLDMSVDGALQLASMSAARVLGRARGAGTGIPTALTVAELLALLRMSFVAVATSYTTATSMTTINFATEYTDTDGMHDTGSNTNRLTIVNSGPYLFLGHTYCETATANNLGLQLRDNSGNVLSTVGTTEAAGADTKTGATLMYVVQATAGQWFELQAEWGTASLSANAFFVAIRLPTVP